MSILAIFTASLIMGFSGAVMPGSLLTVTIRESLHRGVRAGIEITTGHALLELVLVVALFYGFGTVITWPAVKGLIGVVGGLFLLWMAYGSMKEALGSAMLDFTAQADGKSLHPVYLGITVSASNPYWSIWWATAGAGSLMLAAKDGAAGAASFYLGHVSADYIWYSLVSFAVAKGKKLFTPGIYRLIVGACGLFLFALAIYFVYSGLSFWGVIRLK
jgi:threonine/homoserine/homoserine lactone efflux protein